MAPGRYTELFFYDEAQVSWPPGTALRRMSAR